MTSVIIGATRIEQLREQLLSFKEQLDQLKAFWQQYGNLISQYRKGPTIKRGARVGANSTLLPGVTIGREAFVATGSIVTRDVPDETLVMGSPARPVRAVPEREFVDHQ